jgi:TRAP-type C4-dicarboxylate transport system substrate-binding protein
MVPFSGMYQALKAKTFDGQSDPLGVAQSLRLYEVQTYLSLTGHWWSGFTLLAHGGAWQALPREIQTVVERNAGDFAQSQREDVAAINAAGEAELARQGMVVNAADTASIRARLDGFYARWKARFDPAVWALVEAHGSFSQHSKIGAGGCFYSGVIHVPDRTAKYRARTEPAPLP